MGIGYHQVTQAVALVLMAVAAPSLAGRPAAAPPPAASPADAFHREIASVYGFDKKALKGDGIYAQSAKLDAFWKKVAADKGTYLPLLRAELVRTDNPAFFSFDGAELLRNLSDDRADGALALRSIERVDPATLNPGGYFQTLNWFTSHGYDTRKAALKWMDNPKQEIMVDTGLHILWYQPWQALIFSLFGMDEEKFVGDLVARLDAEKNDFAIEGLINAIWATATPAGRAALQAYADRTDRPKPARDYARASLIHKGDGPPSGQSEAALRKARRDVIASPFGHNRPEEFHRITDELVKIAK
jgi:hypothetical protein